MQFILFRHAHKGIFPYEDPELSNQGFEQAVRLNELAKNKALPAPTQIWISPKKRTSQTLYPIAKEFAISPVVKAELDQRSNEESSISFRKRVHSLLNLVSEKYSNNEVIYACTHYDWIEEAMTLINCDKDLGTFEFSNWAPSQFLIFEINAECWKLLKKGDAK